MRTPCLLLQKLKIYCENPLIECFSTVLVVTVCGFDQFAISVLVVGTVLIATDVFLSDCSVIEGDVSPLVAIFDAGDELFKRF